MLARQTVQRLVSIAFFVILPLLASGLGCAPDHRISLSDFLEIQRQRQLEDTRPRPAPEQMAALRVEIDRRLGPYLVGPDDVLRVDLASLDGSALVPQLDARVHPDGTVDLPLVGPVPVSGKDLSAVEADIHNAYVPGYIKDLAVHVEVATPEYTQVLVRGAVLVPGLIPLRRTERNLLFAIVAAGGVTSAASGEVTLRRLREPSEQVKLNLADIDQLQAALSLEPLATGDMITVHAAMSNTIFVGGLVNLPRPQQYDPGVEVTVLQALAASGGLRQDLLPDEGTLIRRMPDGEDVHVRLDLDRIAMGTDPNITLAAGDVLWVPHTAKTRILEFINRNIFLRAGASVTYTATAQDFLNSNAERAALQDFDRTADPFGSLIRQNLIQNIPTTQP